MAYDEKLADRVRELISLTQNKVEEKRMFGGLSFMVNGKITGPLAGKATIQERV